MRIDANLRAAIKAVAETAKRQTYNRAARDAARSAAVANYVATKNAAPVREAYAAYTKANKAVQVAEEVMAKADAVANNHGLHFSPYKSEKAQTSINNDSDFVNAGGKLPPEFTNGWDANQVIAELVAAPEKDKAAILKKFGIIWG